MSKLLLLRLGLAFIGIVLLILEVRLLDRWFGRGRLSKLAIALVAATNILFVAYLWFSHINFPLHLDLMEGTVFQHLQRAASFRPVYPAPSSEFVPLAYNPLYYYFTIPFTWIFGVKLFTLRLVAILGMFGCGVAIFITVKQKTRSTWWALVAVGLFAAAYRAMDTYLDNAHSDSWFLCTALWGTFLLDQKRSRLADLAGLLLLMASFWFKQHGALFVIGGILYLTWRHGLLRSLPYWIAVLLTGPVAYWFLGPRLFGSHFHYFTWEIPRHWTTLDYMTFSRFLKFILLTYPLLALLGGLIALHAIRRERGQIGPWPIQMFFATATGFMGALDKYSANNVFIAMGTWFILLGTIGLHHLTEEIDFVPRWRLDRLALLLSFVLLVYDPREVVVSPRAHAAYDDLISYLDGLPGTVYAPTIGQLEGGYTLYPGASWPALEDMYRGPGREVRNQPEVRRLLEPCLHPAGKAYLLTNWPLRAFPVIEFLDDSYELEADLGNRFLPLHVLPKRYGHGWPHYLYRFRSEPSKAAP